MAENIEREAALNALCYGCCENGECEIECAMWDAIASIPAADVVPVRHGRWIWNPDGMDWGLGAWCCSECKSKAETWWANDKKYNPLRCSGGHFCGNCGARMDGDRE